MHPNLTNHSKPKTTLGTKRQFHGDSTHDQKPKKQASDTTLKCMHPNSVSSESLPNPSTPRTSSQTTPLPNTSHTSTMLETGQHDSSFLDQIIAGIRPVPPNLNTYTQLTL